jgi:hypothetical protein
MRLASLALATATAAVACSSALAEEPPGDTRPSTDATAPAAHAQGAAAPDPAAASRPAAEPAPPGEAPAAPAGRDGGERRWGILAALGVPQGATISAAYRPVPMIRLFAGPAWNYLGFGIQGGLSVAPWRLAVTPVLTVEGGRYFGANASFLASGGQGVPPELKPLLKDMSYAYAAVHAGIEIGNPEGFAFALDLGLGYVALDAKGSATKTDSSGATATFRDPRVRATLPALKLGFHYWF